MSTSAAMAAATMALQPKDESWLREVSSTIGGSSAAAAIGLSRFGRGPVELFHSLLAARSGDAVSGVAPNDDMRRGSLNEPIALALLAEQIGPIEPHEQSDFLYNDDFPYAHSLPDGWTVHTAEERPAIVEVKSPRPGTVARINRSGVLPDWLTQCQHNMAVTGAQVCHLGVYDPILAFVLHVPIERDDRFIEQLMEREAALWACVLKEQPPQDIEPPEFDEPEIAETKIVLDTDDARIAARNFLRLRDLESEAKAAKQVAADHLTSLAPEAAYFEVPNVFYDGEETSFPSARFHHKQQQRRTFNKAAVLKKHPELDSDEFYKVSVSRPLRPYPGTAVRE